MRTLGQQDDQVITADKKRGIRIFFWQQDSEHILYLQDQDGDENWHVYQTNLKNRNTRDLTPFQGVQAQVVAVDPNFPHEMLVGLNLEDRSLHDVYRLDLRTGAVVLDTKNPGDVSGWSVDNQMQVRVASVFLPDGGTELRLREDPKSDWRSFQRWSADETFGGVAAFTPDNGGAWIISSVDANASRLVEFDLAQGTQRVIAEDDQYDVDSLMIHPTRRTLEAVSFVRAREEWTLLDAALKPDFAALQKVRDGDFNVVSRDLADRTWIVSYTVDDGPVYFYAYDRGEKRADLLFSNRADLEGLKLAKMRPISFTARDGLTIHGYLTLPVGLPPRNLPLVLNVHGGPWGRDTWGLDPETQWLANRGYAVLQVNFRGSTGYGKKFLNAGDREWGGAMHHDLLDAKEWAVREGYADPDRGLHLRRQLRRLRHARWCDVHPGRVRLRRGHRRSLEHRHSDQVHPALLGAAQVHLRQAGRQRGNRGGIPERTVASLQGRPDQGSVVDRAGRQRSPGEASRERPDRRRHAQEQQTGDLPRVP